ncbi:MAG: hypothetical protein M1164_00240 [Candidatus Marsarchaeota archaeon]|nr:hypothetical protein [Candidatus Marsarchaeota archaeon]
MEHRKIDYSFIKSKEDWDRFLKSEGLYDYEKIRVKRAKVKGWVRFAFWFLRAYVTLMVVIIALGFLHIL